MDEGSNTGVAQAQSDSKRCRRRLIFDQRNLEASRSACKSGRSSSRVMIVALLAVVDNVKEGTGEELFLFFV